MLNAILNSIINIFVLAINDDYIRSWLAEEHLSQFIKSLTDCGLHFREFPNINYITPNVVIMTVPKLLTVEAARLNSMGSGGMEFDCLRQYSEQQCRQFVEIAQTPTRQLSTGYGKPWIRLIGV